MLALKDDDHLAARLRGRRSRLAEGPRLAGFCALGTPAALAAAVLPGLPAPSPAETQRALAGRFVEETLEIAACLGGGWKDYARLQAGRWQLENLKTLVRGLSAGAPKAEISASLLALPGGDWAALAAAGSVEGLRDSLPKGRFRESLSSALSGWPGRPAFFLEAALERDHLAALGSVCGKLGGEDGAVAAALGRQEAAAFDLMTAARGRFFHGFAKEELLPLYAPCAGLEKWKYEALLSAADPGELRGLAAGAAVDPGPAAPGLTALEGLCRRRYARLARRALLRARSGAGVAAGYIALRRLETAALISAAEGLRLGTDPGELAARVVQAAEGAYA